MPLLPAVSTAEQYKHTPRDGALYDAAVAEVARAHGLPPGAPRRKYPSGDSIVFAVGAHHVVKLFPPPLASGARAEARVLAHVHGRLGLPTPALHATGTLEGWPYLVMEQLPGCSLREAWPRLAGAEREALVGALGAGLGRLHALTPPLALPPPQGSWERFVAAQRQGCVERQRARGVPEAWLAQVPDFLDAALALPDPRPPTALLHTEVMRDHALVLQEGGRWRLTGLIDFEPAMQGHPDYELASVGVFLSGGEPALLRAFCTGYGWEGGALPRAVRWRALAFALMHRYSNFRWYLETVPPPPGTDTLEALADAWWATE